MTDRKVPYRLLLLIGNVIVLTGLLYVQKLRYEEIFSIDFDSQAHGDILLNVALMEQNGDDINQILLTSLGLLVANVAWYRNVAKLKHWILEPITILVLSFALTFYTYLKRLQVIQEKQKTTYNTNHQNRGSNCAQALCFLQGSVSGERTKIFKP
jgi:hypothetical protein